jgi:hypothetical protein
MRNVMGQVLAVFKRDGDLQDVKGTDGKMYKLASKSRTVYEERKLDEKGLKKRLVRIGQLSKAGELIPA